MCNTEKKIIEFLKHFPKNFKPKVAVVLGTRMSGFVELLSDVQFINFSDIKGFPKATGIGHRGRFALGYIGQVPIIVSDGRIHYYEGYSMDETVLGIRLMHKLGAEVLLTTNISGVVNKDICVGDFMLIKDQVNLFIPSPLIGLIPRRREDRFVDMGSPYDSELNEIAINLSSRLRFPICEGVYVQVAGPQYETKADVNILRALGADVVGMSTASEVIVARQLGMKVCGISYISNNAGESIDIETRKNNLKLAEKRYKDFYFFLEAFIRELERECL